MVWDGVSLLPTTETALTLASRRREISLRVVRVLLVDDSVEFRRFVRRILETNEEFQLVGEAADGLEAVRLATQLRPDLILLDVGLPGLDGLHAAKTILQAVPETRIIFVTTYCSKSLAGAALNLGAKGYVVKADAGKDLLCAIERVLSNKQFVSTSVEDWASSE